MNYGTPYWMMLIAPRQQDSSGEDNTGVWRSIVPLRGEEGKD